MDPFTIHLCLRISLRSLRKPLAEDLFNSGSRTAPLDQQTSHAQTGQGQGRRLGHNCRRAIHQARPTQAGPGVSIDGQGTRAGINRLRRQRQFPQGAKIVYPPKLQPIAIGIVTQGIQAPRRILAARLGSGASHPVHRQNQPGVWRIGPECCRIPQNGHIYSPVLRLDHIGKIAVGGNGERRILEAGSVEGAAESAGHLIAAS